MTIVSAVAPVEVELPEEVPGRGDVPVKSWIDRIESGLVFVTVQLRSGQVLGWGYGTDYFLTEKELAEVGKR